MHVPAACTVRGLLGTRELGGALQQELPQGSPCPAWPRGALWGVLHSSPPTYPIATPFQGWARRWQPPSPAGRHAEEVGHLVHVVGGQQHHLLILREVVVEDAVQQALPLELAGWARHPRATRLSASPPPPSQGVTPAPGAAPSSQGSTGWSRRHPEHIYPWGQWGMFLGTQGHGTMGLCFL